MARQVSVVLLQDVQRLGVEGAVVRVTPGFARNYLIPSGVAAPATVQQLKDREERVRQRSQKSARIKEQADRIKHKLEGYSLTLKLSLGVDDKPFGSITAHDILGALTQDGFELAKHDIRLESPIKSLGIFEIPVRLHTEVTAILKLWVVKE